MSALICSHVVIFFLHWDLCLIVALHTYAILIYASTFNDHLSILLHNNIAHSKKRVYEL